MRIAVLDDWQKVARELADWSALAARSELVFFDRPLAGEEAAAELLGDFDIILTMRERTPFPRSLIERLPRLKMLGMTGYRAKAIDIAGLLERGVTVCYTQGGESGAETAEHTLGLILAAARQIPAGDSSIRNGGFTDGVRPGLGLAGRTLGLVGLGRIGRRVAGYAKALEMEVVAWSRNLTPERAAEFGVRAVSRAEVFSLPDFVSLHVYLAPETQGLVTAADLARMKPGAVLVNTARAGLVDQAALLAAVQQGRIAAALDVYETEPLTADDPWRQAPNTILTPHVGYGVREVLEVYYDQMVENAVAFLDGAPIRTHGPAVSESVAAS